MISIYFVFLSEKIIKHCYCYGLLLLYNCIDVSGCMNYIQQLNYVLFSNLHLLTYYGTITGSSL